MKPKFVIGLGASAGGLEALERFFDPAPANSGDGFTVTMRSSHASGSTSDGLHDQDTTLNLILSPTAAAEGRIVASVLEITKNERSNSTSDSTVPPDLDLTAETEVSNAGNARFQRQNVELARLNRDFEQFASVVAHDLRAPLRHISQFSEFLKEDEADRLSEEGQEYLKIITDGASTMSEMVEGLLEYARVGRNRRAFTECDLNDCLTVATQLLSQPLLEQNATVNVGDLPRIVGDRDLLIRLFQNLIENAVRFAKPATPPVIDVSADQKNGAVRIAVRDNGVGIPAEFSDKVFLLFQKLQTDDDSSGLGLGLAICRRICELHGGAIEVDSTYTDGARFVITWPIERVAPNNRQTA